MMVWFGKVRHCFGKVMQFSPRKMETEGAQEISLEMASKVLLCGVNLARVVPSMVRIIVGKVVGIRIIVGWCSVIIDLRQKQEITSLEHLFHELVYPGRGRCVKTKNNSIRLLMTLKLD